MKKNMIEKYYIDESGEPKVVMNQNAAREIGVAIDAFRAGIEKSNFSSMSQERLTAKYIADNFLQDDKSKEAAENYPGLYEFLHVVEKKIEKLLGKERSTL